MTRRKAMESKPKQTELKTPCARKARNAEVLEIRSLLAEQEKMHLPNLDHQIQMRHLQPLPDIAHQDDFKNNTENLETEMFSTSLKIVHSPVKFRQSIDETGTRLHKPLRGTLDHNPDIYNSFARRQSSQMKLPPLESESKRRSSCPASSNSLTLLDRSPPPSPKSDQGRYRWKRKCSERLSPETCLVDGIEELHEIR